MTDPSPFEASPAAIARKRGVVNHTLALEVSTICAVFDYVDKWLDSIAGDGCVFIEKKLELADTSVPL